jgi:hypothetical protein
MDAVRLFRAMPTSFSDSMVSSFSRTPETVVALLRNQWTARPELVVDFIGPPPLDAMLHALHTFSRPTYDLSALSLPSSRLLRSGR